MSPSAAPELREGGDGAWSFVFPGCPGVCAGIGDRRRPVERVVSGFPDPVVPVQTEQVHGSSIGVLESGLPSVLPVPGCDALVTARANRALIVRSADCLPILIADPIRRVVAAAHAGWRGVAARMPSRLVTVMTQLFHSRAEDLRVALGPGIRPCCYEVGPEFAAFFGAFMREREGKHFCDLPAAATAQLLQAGVRSEHLGDCGVCTACAADRWFSLRKEGPQTGRLAAWIYLTR